MNHLMLTGNRLDLGEINDLVSHETCGAISIFVGTTRDNFEKKKVLSLEYEAYEPMATKQMHSICEEMRQRWPDIVNVAIYHRLGLVPVREASVVIAASSPHRETAIDAVAFAVEELKRRVPIWKKERYENEESAWKENKESSTSYLSLKNIKRKRQRVQLDFSRCVIENEDIDNNLIQIPANEQEIQRRIKCFVERKREEINANNIMDFTSQKQPTDDETENENSSSCARVNSSIIKQEHSKCHLKVRRVRNEIGPQIKPNYLRTLDKLMLNTIPNISSAFNIKQEDDVNKTIPKCISQQNRLPETINERVVNAEEFLKMPTNKSKNFFQRLKAIEDRILYLESISPEYVHFLTQDSSSNISLVKHQQKIKTSKQQTRKIFSIEELNEILAQKEKSLRDSTENNLRSSTETS